MLCSADEDMCNADFLEGVASEMTAMLTEVDVSVEHWHRMCMRNSARPPLQLMADQISGCLPPEYLANT